MKQVCVVTALALSSLCASEAQEIRSRHEIGLTLGGLSNSERTGGSTHLDLGSGVGFQANYGYRLWSGLRLKFVPIHRIAPYLAAGGGWADYEQSTTTIAGAPNPAARTVNHGAPDYGGGVDFKLWRFVALLAEVRDFYGGSPAYNAPFIRGGQHNAVAGGGFVLKFQ
jgi:hypothetical protein